MNTWLTPPKLICLTLISTCTFTLGSGTNPVWAGDPFRTNDVRDIPENTEAAFEAIFKSGNYDRALEYLAIAETNESSEPLTYALRAALAYTDQDWETLQEYALKTQQTAKNLQTQDSLRANLYLAVGYFLEGAYNYKIDEQPLAAINQLQKVFSFLDEAKKQAPQDPELNLIKGYMELLLAVNLPFSDSEQAIENFQQNAAPEYLVNRGIAVAYRDLNQHDQALEFVNRALNTTPDNPELFYLKAQIFLEKGQDEKNLSFLQQAVTYFDRSLVKSEQLPTALVKQIERERRKAQEELEKIS
ncbi:MAG: Sll0314/Alr1548 family TPR repeat-containing protein [Oscillatoria sp. PMC 1068.18]|nr:Sll0314/Alr1548 family TPR repeat-containing protein [Oscillatoria sp. PMC 1076.18]MEC4991370.1 Sll0314/Alr1548 family TPR repeat-containing protein [Oscillatoria sp. PMC 1068.18]